MDKGHVGWSLDFKAIPGLHGPVTKATIAILKQVQDARTAGWRAGVGAALAIIKEEGEKGSSYRIVDRIRNLVDRLLAEGEGGKPK